jgi:hypothetical protein
MRYFMAACGQRCKDKCFSIENLGGLAMGLSVAGFISALMDALVLNPYIGNADNINQAITGATFVRGCALEGLGITIFLALFASLCYKRVTRDDAARDNRAINSSVTVTHDSSDDQGSIQMQSVR